MAVFQSGDTIAAIATPPGRGGVGILRISGPQARAIAQRVCRRKTLVPRHAYFAAFFDADGIAIDSGILLYFQAPHSFTGEDVIEVQGHGGPVVMDLLLRRLFALGARPARAGEFSERAFSNGKLDLAQAEAIADLIDAQTQAQARAAQRSLEGVLSSQVQALHAQLLELRAFIEAAIDFPDEELALLQTGQVAERLAALRAQIQALGQQARQGVLLREGAQVVIAGRPNAGKSSLLNALAGFEAAIVTDIPGTTRDLVREHIQIDGLPLHIIDTAGIRAGGDAVEKMGMARAWQAAEAADVLLVVVDASLGVQADDEEILHRLAHLPTVLVMNKCDLLPQEPPSSPAHIHLSAKYGTGLDALRARLKSLLGYRGEAASCFSATARQANALRLTEEVLLAARANLDLGVGLELVAEDLRRAGHALAEITGEVSSEALLGEIFSRFCVGK